MKSACRLRASALEKQAVCSRRHRAALGHAASAPCVTFIERDSKQGEGRLVVAKAMTTSTNAVVLRLRQYPLPAETRLPFLCFIFLRLYFYFFIFRERGREGEKEGEKYQCVLASHVAPTGYLAHNPGLCPDWELNQRSVGLQPTLNPLSHTTRAAIFSSTAPEGTFRIFGQTNPSPALY